MSDLANDRSSFKFDPLPAIRTMEDFFNLPELANRTIEGGWELLFRNRLLQRLRARPSGDSADSYGREVAVVPGKRKKGNQPSVAGKIADIAAFGQDRLNPSAIIEIKHNFATQSEAFGSLLSDVEKWAEWKRLVGVGQCEFHFIQIIVDVTRLKGESLEIVESVGNQEAGSDEFSISVCRDIFKYGIQADDSRRKERRAEIKARLDQIQKRVDASVTVGLQHFEVKSNRYFDQEIHYCAEVHVFVVSQHADVCTEGGKLEFPRQKRQGPLLHQEKD